MPDTISSSFETVTETPGTLASKEQLERLYTRYKFAADLAAGKKVLEAACGSGHGLGFLSKSAQEVTGIDIDHKLVSIAEKQYWARSRIIVRQGDAQKLDFADNSFDIVLLYEAIYYLPDPGKFIKEAKRVLNAGGLLLICTANKDIRGFNPSPFSKTYFSAQELYDILKQNGFERVELFGDSPLSNSLLSNLISLIKIAAVRFHLMPKTMKGKELFKRIFFGKLEPLPPEVTENMSVYTPPQRIKTDRPDYRHKVIFAAGYK